MKKKQGCILVLLLIMISLSVIAPGPSTTKSTHGTQIEEALTQPPKDSVKITPTEPQEINNIDSTSSLISRAKIPANKPIEISQSEIKSSEGDFTTRSGTNLENVKNIDIQQDNSVKGEAASKVNTQDVTLTQPQNFEINPKEIKTSSVKNLEILDKLTASNLVNLHYNRLQNKITFDSASSVHIFDRNFNFQTMGKTELSFSDNSITSIKTTLIDGSINSYDWPFPLPEDELIDTIEEIGPQQLKSEIIMTNELDSPKTAADELDVARTIELESISNTHLEQQLLNQQDSDNDGILDVVEINNQMNKNTIDTDNDGLSDYDEFLNYPTNPSKSSTFGEPDSTLIDNIRNGIISSSIQSQWDALKLSSFSAFQDTDGDGISNWRELIHNTNPKDADSDHDGLLDSFELTHGTTPSLPTAITSLVGKKRIIKGTGRYTWTITESSLTPSLPVGQADVALNPTTITEEFIQDTIAFTQDQGKVREHSLVTSPIGKEQHTEDTTNIENIAHRILFNDYQHYITGGEVFIEKKDFFKFVFLSPPSLYVYDVKDNPKYYYKNINTKNITIETEIYNYLIWSKKNPAESFAIYRNLPGPYTIIVTKKSTNDKANAIFDLRKHTARITGKFTYRKKLFYAEPPSLTTTVVIDSRKEQAEFMYTKLYSNKFADTIESNHEKNEYAITLSKDNVFLNEIKLNNRISCNEDIEVSRIYNTAYTIYEQCEENSKRIERKSSLLTTYNRPVRRYQYLEKFQSNPIVTYKSDFGDLHSKVFFKKDYFYQDGPSMYSKLPHRNWIICEGCSIGKDSVAQAMEEYTQQFSCVV